MVPDPESVVNHFMQVNMLKLLSVYVGHENGNQFAFVALQFVHAGHSSPFHISARRSRSIGNGKRGSHQSEAAPCSKRSIWVANSTLYDFRPISSLDQTASMAFPGSELFLCTTHWQLA